MSRRSIRSRRVACLAALVVALGLGCSDDPSIQQGSWSISGLSEGTVTLTEIRSGRSWSLDGDGRPRFAWIEIEYPRVGDDWQFEIDVTGSDRLDCTIEDGGGRYDDDEDGYPRFRGAHTSCGIPVDSIDFPDAALADCIDEALETDPADTRDVRELRCPDRGIADLTGLDWFHRLRLIDLSHNAIDELNTVRWNALERIDLLDLSHNVVAALDFEELGLSGLEIDLSYNQIATADGAHAVWVGHLSLRHNVIETFEVDLPPGLERDGSIYSLDLGHNRLVTLDLTMLWDPPAVLDVEHNDLEQLAIGNFGSRYYYRPYEPRRRLHAAFNQLSSETVGSPPARRLTLPVEGYDVLDVSYNDFTEIPGEYVTDLTLELVARGNAIDTVDLDHAESLELLDLADNVLAVVDLSTAESLRTLDLADNALGDFDWSTAPANLEDVDLSGNDLFAFDECDAASLLRLTIEDAGLTSLDLSRCPSLVIVELAGNDFAALDVSANADLEEIDLRDNPLTCDAVEHVETTLPGVALAWGPDACVP